MTPITVFLMTLLGLGVIGFIISALSVGEGSFGAPRETTIVALSTLVVPAILAGITTAHHMNSVREITCTITGINHSESSIFTEECGELPVHTTRVSLDEIPTGRPSTLTVMGVDSWTIVRGVS